MHQAVCAGVGDGDERERRPGACLLVLFDLGAEVQIGEDVAVEHHEALVEHRLGELQRPRRPARFGLLDEAQAQAHGGAVTKHVAHAGGQKAARHDHVIDAVPAEPLEHEGDEGTVHQRHHRLGNGGGERAQAFALAPHENDRLHQRAASCAPSAGAVCGGVSLCGALARGSPCAPRASRDRGRRPMPSYTSPAARIAAGSRALRPSTTTLPAIACATVRQSSSRNSGHSVTSTTASASVAASSAEEAKEMPLTSSRACSSATGSYAVTRAPSAFRRAASTSEEASRMSSVCGLKARPNSATRLPGSSPRCFCSLAITRRFCSSLTSMTAVSSWKW